MPRKKRPVDVVGGAATVAAAEAYRASIAPLPRLPKQFVLRAGASYMTPWGNNYQRDIPFIPAHNEERAFLTNHPDFEEV